MSTSSSLLTRDVSQRVLQQLAKTETMPLRVMELLLACMETPRPSDACDAIRAKLTGVAKSSGFDVAQDSAGNLRIRKPASAGCEGSVRVCIQAHLDMVTSKTTDSQHDFYRDPIEPILTEDGFLKADRTTLGADDAIGMAAALALLESKDVVHGPIECLFTADEETTMDGAAKVDRSLLQSEVLINVDSEEEHSVCMGCAGGFEKYLRLPVVRDAALSGEDFVCLRVFLQGLLGGHTGRANALQLLARMLNHTGHVLAAESKEAKSAAAAAGLRILSLSGGNAPNAIPRDATADIVVAKAQSKRVEAILKDYFEVLRAEFAFETEKKVESKGEAKGSLLLHSTMKLELSTQTPAVLSPCNAGTTQRMLDLMLSAPHGVLRMNRFIAGEVDTSISFSKAGLLAPAAASAAKAGEADSKAAAAGGESKSQHSQQQPAGDDSEHYDSERFLVHVMCRANHDDSMHEVERRLEALARLSGCSFSKRINYFPGWEPAMNTTVLKAVTDAHKQLFGKDPRVYSVHAGLECGYLCKQYPKLHCVSIGPVIEDAHSPDERLLLASVGPFFAWLKATVTALSKVKSSGS